MEIPEEKKWAEGMTQKEFEGAFTVMYPRADAIPGDVKAWLKKSPPKYHGIPPINPEEIIPEDYTPKNMKVLPNEVTCDGCGEVFTAARNMKYAHKAKHEKICEKLLAKRGKGVDHAISG
jgi:hypothetical protein